MVQQPYGGIGGEDAKQTPRLGDLTDCPRHHAEEPLP